MSRLVRQTTPTQQLHTCATEALHGCTACDPTCPNAQHSYEPERGGGGVTSVKLQASVAIRSTHLRSQFSVHVAPASASTRVVRAPESGEEVPQPRVSASVGEHPHLV